MMLFSVTLLNQSIQNISVFDILMDFILLLLVYLQFYSRMSDRLSFYFKQHKHLLQDFIQALLLTSVFHEGLSFMDVAHKPKCINTLTLAVVGSRECCKPPTGCFSDPRFSNSLSIKTKRQVI